MNYLWPALTILFFLPLLNKRASLWLAPGTALALVGVSLVMRQGARVSWMSFMEHLQSNPVAYALASAAAMLWALYSNPTRRWSGPESSGAVELFIPAMGLVLLALRLLTTEPTGWSLRAVGEASGLAAVTTLAYFLWDVSIVGFRSHLLRAYRSFTRLASQSRAKVCGVACVTRHSPLGSQSWRANASTAAALNAAKLLRPSPG